MSEPNLLSGEHLQEIVYYVDLALPKREREFLRTEAGRDWLGSLPKRERENISEWVYERFHYRGPKALRPLPPKILREQLRTHIQSR